MERNSVAKLLQHPVAKPLVFAASLAPFAYLAWAAFANALGANPAEALIRSTGDWTLRFLAITLAVTPLRVITGQNQLLRFRRMLGLFAFFYGTVHVLCYAGLDMGLHVGDIARDIVKRPFILAGFTALVLMAPLAATSFNRAIRALGARRWQRLHQLVYVVAPVGLLHFWWMRAGKNDFAEPAVYIAIIGALLGWRVWHRWRGEAVKGTLPFSFGRPGGR
ncbi:MAG: sulfoxide reductase heme-binding subunit YedZ [Betaproteobacteria bacterium]|nr:sulfoxide reductase heme-binding subunit YedZ [Betaproteobacteria bacterium]